IHLGLQQECGCVRPIKSICANNSATPGKSIRLNRCERTWSRDTRQPCTAELIPFACIERCRANRGLPFAVWGAWLLVITGHITSICYLERLQSTSNVYVCGGLHGIFNDHTADRHCRTLVIGVNVSADGCHASDVNLAV